MPSIKNHRLPEAGSSAGKLEYYYYALKAREAHILDEAVPAMLNALLLHPGVERFVQRIPRAQEVTEPNLPSQYNEPVPTTSSIDQQAAMRDDAPLQLDRIREAVQQAIATGDVDRAA